MNDPIIAITGTTLGVLGSLSVIVNIVIELIKDCFPKIPTKLVTIIVSIIVCLTYSVVTTKTFGGEILIFGIFGGLIVAYSAMNGFETIKELKNRFTIKIKEKGGDDDGI